MTRAASIPDALCRTDLRVTTLTLDPCHPEVDAILTRPDVMHAKLTRCGGSYARSGAGRTLYAILPALSTGHPQVIVQSDTKIDWTPLRQEMLVRRVSSERLDLESFVEGSVVNLEVSAIASRHRGVVSWKKPEVTYPDALRRYCSFLGLDPERVKDLRRDGATWSWELDDGSTGSRTDCAGHQILSGKEECTKWFRERVFVVSGDCLSVEFARVEVGNVRLVRVTHDKAIPSRAYSAQVVVTNADEFRKQIASGIGKYRQLGLGLVRTRLLV